MFGLKTDYRQNLVKEAVAGFKMPILMFDQIWLALFPKDLKSEKIQSLERKIIDLMKEEARIKQERREISANKRDAIKRINDLTTAVHIWESKTAIKEMDKCKKTILKANAKFILMDRRLKAISDEMAKANSEFLEEATTLSYDIMKESRRRLDFLEPHLIELRLEMDRVIKELAINEIRFDNTTELLNILVGKDVVKKLDEEDWTDKKKWFWE